MNPKRVSGIYRSKEFLNSSVKDQNPNVILELYEQGERGRTLGVKDSSEIDGNLLFKLKEAGYVWNTLDRCSDRGRALDLSLLNPITGKPMIGSSSGTAINILYGLNDLGIGTDGGGSVLAPAIGLNLYSCLCSGIGLKGTTEKKSTDNISFVPGIGFISGYFQEIKKVSQLFLSGVEDDPLEKIKISLESGMEKYLTQEFKEKTGSYKTLQEVEINERDIMIPYLEEIFKGSDIFIYLEKNIEVEGTGDTVFGSMGEKTLSMQNLAGKKFIKVLNMIEATAITIPTESLGTAIVIVGKKGEKQFKKILEIGELLNREYRPPLYRRYFLDYPLAKIDSRVFKI